MIRIGIVGCGRILAAHLRGYRLLREAGFDGFRITALCARKQDDARMYLMRGSGPPQRPAVSAIEGDPLAIGNEYLSDFQYVDDVEVYTDYRKMIADSRIDAVNDFTTHAMHHQIAAAAFEHGKHLLSQKPLAVTVRAARHMCDAAERSGVTFGVFENFRFTPTTRALKWAFENERLGAVQMILVGYVGTWWAPDRIVAETPWRHVAKEGGGISLDLGVHFFDQIRFVVDEIKNVSAVTHVIETKRQDAKGTVVDCDADDTVVAAATTESGAAVSLTASWAGHAAATQFDTGTVYYGAGGRIAGDRVDLDDGSERSLNKWFEQEAEVELKAKWFPLGLRDSFALSQYDWLRAIADSRQPETDGTEGLRDLAAAYALVESAAARREIAVEDVISGRVGTYQQPIDARFRIA